MSEEKEKQQQIADDVFVSEEKQAGGESVPADRMLRLKLYGEEYVFKNEEEASRVLESLINRIQLEATLSGAQAAGGQQGQQQRGSYVSGAEPPRVPKPDPKKFVELLEKNPAEAFDYVDHFRYQAPPAQVRSALRGVVDFMNRLALEVSASTFVQNTPEYEPTPENRTKLLQVLVENNLPPTPAGFKAAFETAVERGLIKKREVAPVPAETPSAPFASMPVPSPGRASATTGPAVDWNKVRSMSTEELKKRIEELTARMRQAK